MSTPKYKVGDIVQILPWEDFDEHISIPGEYWRSLMGQDLRISNIQADSSYSLTLDGKPVSCIYYNFKGRSYAWCEEFLKMSQLDFLPEELFEV